MERMAQSSRKVILFTVLIVLLFALILHFGCANRFSQVNENKNVVRRYFEEGINQGNVKVADEILTSNFVKYNNGTKSEEVGPEVLKQAISSHIRNNTEYEFLIEDLIAEGDKVAVRWRWRSTNVKYGEPKEVTSQGISIFHFNDGKIGELWQTFDVWGFNKQLGFDHIPPASTEANKD
jgi:predicted SnoaL-like aldol condensation-catalyzing enzyme